MKNILTAVLVMVLVLAFLLPQARSQNVANTETPPQFDFPLQVGNVWTWRTSSNSTSNPCFFGGCDYAKWEVVEADSTTEKGVCGQIFSKRIHREAIQESTFQLCMKDNILTRYPGTMWGDMFANAPTEYEIMADFNKSFCDDEGLCEFWSTRVFTDKVDTMMRRVGKMPHYNSEEYYVFTFFIEDGYERGGGWKGYLFDEHTYESRVGFRSWEHSITSRTDYPVLVGHYLNGVLTGDTTFIRNVSIDLPDDLPREIGLGSNPNPFNPTTTINYAITEAGHASVRVYDLHGREVATLVNEVKAAGSHRVQFDASRLSSGIYLVELRFAGQRTVHKITLMK